MTYFRNVSIFFIVPFILAVIGSCSYLQSILPSVPPPAPPPEQPSKKHVLTSISTQNPQKGIDDYRVECAKHPKDQALTKEYIKGLEDLRTSADGELAKGEFASAGRLYNVLFKNYRDFRTFSKKLSFDRTYLRKRLSYCKTILSRKGFEEYRKGNLNEAIGYWHGYLAIDPNNADIRKALNTASVQQKNLEQKN